MELKRDTGSPLRGAELRRRATDAYIITMLLIFPLFTGFSGYGNITLSKYIFFLAATSLWLAALAALTVIFRAPLPRLNSARLFALLYLAAALLSFAFSGEKADCIIGAGRYDGLVSTLGYVAVFLGVSAFGKPSRLHWAALGLSFTVCCLIALFQLCGVNLFGLFPAGLTYYDGNELYSGVFLSTFGNTNIFDDFLCLGIPAFFALFTLGGGRSRLCLIPLALGAFVVGEAGGDGARLALFVAALIMPPMLFTGKARLARGLDAAGCCLLALALAGAFRADYTDRVLSLSLGFSWSFFLPAAAGLAALLAAFILTRSKAAPEGVHLRPIFAGLSAGALALSLAAVYFMDLGGALGEMHNVLHGRVSGEYGSSRLMIWRACLDAWASRPLLGHGPGALANHIDISLSRYIEFLGRDRVAYIDNAHNDYLAVLVNTGAVGLASYIAFLASGLMTWIKNHRPSPAFAIGALAFGLHSFFGLGLCISAPLFWLALGMCCTEGPSNLEEQIEKT